VSAKPQAAGHRRHPYVVHPDSHQGASGFVATFNAPMIPVSLGMAQT